MKNEESIEILEAVKFMLDNKDYSDRVEEAINMAIEALKEMSHLHLICPHCLNDFYYNTITQSFEIKEGET